MSRLSRTCVWLSTAGALLVVAHLNDVRAPLRLLTVSAFIVAGLLGRIRPALAIWLTLFLVYLTPALFRVLAGHNASAYVTPWLAAVLGLVTVTAGTGAWSLPGRWRWPLITWALTLAVSWPLVAWRELDFGLARLAADRLPVAGIKVAPAGAVAWTAHTASIQLVGLLFVDWLWCRYRAAGARLWRIEVISPLAAGVLAACLVSLYQSAVDISFASGHVWPSIHRATGTLMDSNVFGMVAALWGPIFVVLAATGALPWPVAIALTLLSWAGVWTSASRTALLAGLVGTVSATLSLAMMPTVEHKRTRTAIAGTALLLFLLVLQLVPLRTTNAIERNQYLVPSMDWASVRETMRELWDRDGYGSSALTMIREYPAVGVGIGCFHLLAHDFQLATRGISIPPDNAQNWFRHQFAELGLIGSVGWMAWCLVFASELRRMLITKQWIAVALAGPILGFTLASLLGMPSQDAAVTLTFWVLVFWCGVTGGVTTEDEPRRMSKVAWLFMFLLVAGYGIGRTMASDLRPPFRSARFGFPYSYGVYSEGPNQVWTAEHGVTVLDATQDWLKLTVWVSHPDADQKPVSVDVWIDRDHVINDRVRRGERIYRHVRVPKSRRFVLEAKVDRTFRPSEHGQSSDDRDLGLAMKWEFVERPPG